MKTSMKRILSMILVIVMITTSSLTSLAEAVGGSRQRAGDVFSLDGNVTWAEAGKQIAGMLGYIVEDAANIDLSAYAERVAGLSLQDDSVYLAILAENGYLPEGTEPIDPASPIKTESYVQLLETAFPTVVDSQEAIDSLRGAEDVGNVAIMGDNLSMSTLLPRRIAVASAQQLSLTAVKADALSLNAGSSVTLSESEIARVNLSDRTAEEHSRIYLHMDAGTQLPEIVIGHADEVVIEGSGALGVVRVQEQVGTLTVRATGSVINETDAAMDVTGPDGQVVTLQSGEQVDFVLSKWLVSFVTEGTPVATQEVAPGGMVDFNQATTTLEGKIFTAWYEDAAYTQPVSRLSTVNKQTTLYARFVDEADAVVVTFETFGGRELEPLVFARGEYLLTKPVEKLYTSRDGYSFGGWCADEDCTTAFGYTDPIQESMTLYAMYASYEQEVREDPGTVAQVELADGAATIALVLPEGMSTADALENLTVESGTGAVTPEIAVRETGDGAEIYCEAGFVPGTTFTLQAQNGVTFADYPAYIDTLTVSVYREEVEVVEFAQGLTYVLWDEVLAYTPVSQTQLEYTTDYAADGTEYNMLEDHDAQGDVFPGELVMKGETALQPEQIVVFYDGEINRDEATIDAWTEGDLNGYVLFAKIEGVTLDEEGNSMVTFRYADPEEYITALDVHTTEEVNMEDALDEEQIAQVERAITSQLASNDELKAQMLVAVMTSEETQRMLDDQYGAGVYSLAALRPRISDPKLDVKLSVKGSTATAGIGVGVTVALRDEGETLIELTPYLYFEEQLTLDINVDGGSLWIDMSVRFNTKSTIRLELTANTGSDAGILDEAKSILAEIVNADGTANEGDDYQQVADDLMHTMQELVATELEYQDLFAVPLLRLRYSYMGIITVGINVELVGQAAVVATFGVTVTAEYGQKIGFNYDFKKFKGGSYKEKTGSEVTTDVYLIGKIGTRLGISVTLYIKMCQLVTVSITGSVYAYVELAGMFMYSYALSAGGGNAFGALNLEVGIDIEIELALKVNLIVYTVKKEWTLWSHRWKLYSMSRGMTMGVVQAEDLEEMWADAITDADYKTSYALPYLPMKTYNMLDASCTENQMLFADLSEGNVTARLTLENVCINGEMVSLDDPRVNVVYAGDGTNGSMAGTIYADEYAAADYKVESYECDVVLTYENRNASELIKRHQQRFHFAREFKLAVTSVNVNIVLYDWCAHAWGIEATEWDNTAVHTVSFQNTHVLGSPTEPSATGEIDLSAVIAAVREAYPELADKGLSWFDPTRNAVDRVVQYSIPRISNLCYLTPESRTVRYDVFETTNTYDLTFYLYASCYAGYSGEITYIIEGDEVPADAVFTLDAGDGSETMTFAPVEGEDHRWTLTLARAQMDGSERPVMMSLEGGDAFASGLIVTGREAEETVILSMGDFSSQLSVNCGTGVLDYVILNYEQETTPSIAPGTQVTLQAEMEQGYRSLSLTSDPEGLAYTTDGDTITFTMPSHDVAITLEGVRHYEVKYLYHYGDLGVYRSVDAKNGERLKQPKDPAVDGLTFAGWYDNADCTGEPYDFSRKVTGNVTLYAAWYANVTVDLGGARAQAKYVAERRTEDVDGEEMEIIVSAPVFPGDEATYTGFTYTTRRLGETALEIVLPNHDGYDFLGWYLTPDFSGEAVDPAAYVLSGGVTFYARWARIAILTYELNDGVERDEPYAMALEHAGLMLTTIPEAPQRECYNFLGWYRMPGGQAADYIDTETYIVEGSMTLYACWEPVQYTITYELNGGENDPANPATYTVESDTIVFAAPVRRGYDFAGWMMDGMEIVGDSVACIPAGSAGDVTLTAMWSPTVYTISYDLVRGETETDNPTTYTVESDAITLNDPMADGYEFTGWSGTDLTEPTTPVVIPAGSVGNRSYKANWLTTDPVGRIVSMALASVPEENTIDLADFTGMDVMETVAMEAITAGEKCADYLAQLSVTAVQQGEADEDGTAYYYMVQVTVTFTEDNGNTVSDSKTVELKVLKTPVTITASVVYPTDREYMPYGTALYDMQLGACTALSGETEVEGTFAWADPSVVPLGANNGEALYKVVFTPTDSATYSTAETLIAVNTQIGLLIKLTADPVFEYTGQKIYKDYYAHGYDIDDSEKLVSGAWVSVPAGYIQQSQLTPGTATIMLAPGEGERAVEWIYSGDVQDDDPYDDDGPYVVVCDSGERTATTFTIVRATPEFDGQFNSYRATVGDVLNSIVPDVRAYYGNWDEPYIDGVFEWKEPNTVLDTVGNYHYTLTFTPDDLTLFTTSSREIYLDVYAKSVEVPTIAPVIYDGSYHEPVVPTSDYYTIESANGGTDAGDYAVVLKLKDAENYVWSDGTEGATKELTFTIQPAELTISGTASVMKLGYGQRLIQGQDGSTDRDKTASDMISGLTVTGVNGKAVTGYWDWDASMTNKALPASAKGDDEDFGDGHAVEARFVLTSEKADNYAALTRTFTVEVARAVPDVKDIQSYFAEGYIYQPASGSPVSPLGDVVPKLRNDPFNPVDSFMRVSGSMVWEEPNRYPTETGYYNAVFIPEAETIDGVTGKNYKNVLVPVHVFVKNTLTCSISVAGGGKYLIDGSIYVSSKAALRNESDKSVYVDIRLDEGNKWIETITAYRVDKSMVTQYSNYLFKCFFYDYDEDTGVPGTRGFASGGLVDMGVRISPVSYNPGAGARYKLTFAGSDSDIWNHVYIQLVITLSDENPTTQTSTYALQGAAMDEAVAESTVEPTTEPTLEPTEEPTVEPTTEPTTEPTEAPTVEPTVEPTEAPTEQPTHEPTEAPTEEPTPEPTAESTPEPTEAPTPEPAPEAPVADDAA